ncbi:MAG: HAMP domain-containing histidine kinase, partial [Clostridia bacterium]|nr:HAMP domain-containing histidine kinase [Clostridia bacterium]
CRRYRAMRGLAESIDELLAGAENIDLGNYSEGEVSILTNEVTKLTVRLREQASELKKDKQMLADSIADISHQIRTPLTAMNLIAASLRDPTADEGKRREALSELTRQLGRVDWLVSALLKLARFDADAVRLNPVGIPLSELVDTALAPLAISMELKNQEVISNISGSAFCDPSWTAEALTNIIKNCSEHMGEGKLFIDAAENPLYSEICIRDTGSGIAKEDLPHLFERFYRGKNSGGSGVGIGLALCRMIVGKQNGTVKAENAKEGGAKFTVRLYKGAV